MPVFLILLCVASQIFAQNVFDFDTNAEKIDFPGDSSDVVETVNGVTVTISSFNDSGYTEYTQITSADIGRVGTSGNALVTSWRENKMILKFSEPVYLGSIFAGLLGKGYTQQFITSEDFPGDTIKAGFFTTQRIIIDKQNVSSIEIDNIIPATALPFWDNINFIPMSEFSDSKTYVPDDVFEQALIDNGLDDILDDSVKTSTILYETILSLNGVGDLTGIEDFYSLVYLYIYSSPDLSGYLYTGYSPELRVLSVNESSLTEVDMSDNDKLQFIGFPNSQLSEITLPLYSDILRLNLSNNQLTSLDVSPYDSIVELKLDSNQLSELNIDNGANRLLTNFSTLGNPSLTCIKTSQDAYANSNLTSVDPSVVFDAECEFTTSITTVPLTHQRVHLNTTKVDVLGRMQGTYQRRINLFNR